MVSDTVCMDVEGEADAAGGFGDGGSVEPDSDAGGVGDGVCVEGQSDAGG